MEVTRDGGHRARRTASAPLRSTADQDQLADLTVPTYVAIAERDSIAGGGKAVERARHLPNATVTVFPDTTHSLPMQAADRLASELPAFRRRAEQR